jgi:molybdopterin converting factor small subunit
VALCNPLPIDASAAGLPGTGYLDVRILMFGMICQATGERQTTLRLPQSATVRDVVSALGDRYGESFLSMVMRTASRKASHSAVAVNGYVVQDLDQAVALDATTATVEIILLAGHEGG